MAKKNNKKVVKNNSAEKTNSKKHWFREFRAELKKVTWPSKKELLENSVVVISMVVIVALIIFVLDLGFKSLTDVEVKQVEKLKNTVEVNETEEDNEETESETLDENLLYYNDEGTAEEQESSVDETVNEESSNDADKTTISTDGINAEE